MSSLTTAPLRGCSFIAQAPDFCFSPEDFDTDSRLMIGAAEQFSRFEVLPVAERLDHQESGLMVELIRKAGDLGFCGPDTPEEFGGLGLEKNLAARILEFLSLNASFSVTVGITSGIGQFGLVLFGTPEQKAQYLPDLSSGKKIGAYALSEPNSGSDALSLSTRADLKDGDYILNGTKMWISNALWADLFLVIAKVDGEKVTAFLVDRDTPGLSIAREEHKMGLKGSSTARLVLEDARVPKRCVLHEVGLGHQVAFNALNMGRFKLASMSLGPARDAMGLAAQYVNERKQFGDLIASFGAIQQKFSLMSALFYAAESMTYRTGSLIDEGFSAWGFTQDGARKAAEEFAVECSIGKVFATEVEAIIVDEALQCFGGYGFTEEFPIARHYRDARVSRIYEGTNEINRLFIFDRIRKRMQEGRIKDSVGFSGFISELVDQAFKVDIKDQAQKIALADMIIGLYAVQSVELRSQKTGELGKQLGQIFKGWANARAAESFQLITGKSVTLPPLPFANNIAVSEEVYRAKGPIRFAHTSR